MRARSRRAAVHAAAALSLLVSAGIVVRAAGPETSVPSAKAPATNALAASTPAPSGAAGPASGASAAVAQASAVPPAAPAFRLPPNAQEMAAKIIGAARADRRAWARLAEMCDRFGARLAGTPAYAKAAAWAEAEMKRDGADVARREDVTLTPWIRGREALTLETPNGPRALPLTGLGNSVGTPENGITAEVLVVRDFEELERRAADAKGRIVVFNFPMRASQPDGGGGYGEAVAYRGGGPAAAGRHGAVAVLVRSVTMLAARAPHTGSTRYADGVSKIPAAAIVPEDADMLARLQAAGTPATLTLVLGAHFGDPVTDHNVVAEIRGRDPQAGIVAVGAHLDSWDLSSSAHDDGAGVIMAMETLRLLKSLGVTPRRTIRVVLFANEERGLDGGIAYAAAHRDEAPQTVAAFEADSGGFRPDGFVVAAGPGAVEALRAAVPLFAPLGTLGVKPSTWAGADFGPLAAFGIPRVGLDTANERYFDYHHSALDTPDKVDPADLADSVAAYALITWLLAESEDTLPRVAVAP